MTEIRVLRVERDGLLQCAICGIYKRHIGGHVKLHGITADEYREQFRLSGPKQGGRGLIGELSFQSYSKAAKRKDMTQLTLGRVIGHRNRSGRHKRQRPLETLIANSNSNQRETCVNGHPRDDVLVRSEGGGVRCRPCQRAYRQQNKDRFNRAARGYRQKDPERYRRIAKEGRTRKKAISP